MPKLYEILGQKLGWSQKKEEPKIEEQLFNPVKAKIGGSVSIDYLDYRGKNFSIQEIRQYDTELGGKDYLMVDYVLLSKGLDNKDETIKLRLAPADETDSTKQCRSMVLTKLAEFAYDEQFIKGVLNDASGQFNDEYDEYDEDGKHVCDEYFRCGGVKEYYKAEITSAKDNLEKSELSYWDYSRTAKLDGVDTEQYIYVEMNGSDGWFTIWQGEEVDPSCVEVF